MHHVLPDPVAVSHAYGLDQPGDRVVLVYDLGGNTFQTALVCIEGKEPRMVHQRTERDLGGLAWDRRIVHFLKEQYQKETGLDARLTHDEVLFREWLEKAEMARMQLAECERVS